MTRAETLAADLATLPVITGDPASEAVGELVGELRWLIDQGQEIEAADEAIGPRGLASDEPRMTPSLPMSRFGLRPPGPSTAGPERAIGVVPHCRCGHTRTHHSVNTPAACLVCSCDRYEPKASR